MLVILEGRYIIINRTYVCFNVYGDYWGLLHGEGSECEEVGVRVFYYGYCGRGWDG